VGLKPSAIQGKARLRGLCQIIYSKTIEAPHEPIICETVAHLHRIQA